MSVPDEPRNDKSDEWPLEDRWLEVPWSRVQAATLALYALSGRDFLAVTQQWQRGDPEFLSRLSHAALVALWLAATAELVDRFGVSELPASP